MFFPNKCIHLLFAASLLGGAFEIRAAVLKPYLVTEREVIQLKDVFDGLTQHGDIVIAPSPQAGQKNIFDGKWLKNIARQYQIEWVTPTGQETFTVERKGTLLDSIQLGEKISPLVQKKLGLPDGLVVFDSNGPKAFVADMNTCEVSLENCAHDAQSGRLTLTVSLKDKGQIQSTRLALGGKFIRKIQVPVLKKNARPGQSLGEEDIEMREVMSNTLLPQTIRTAEDIIGREPNYRSLKAGQPLTTQDLKTAFAIKQGDIVTMVLKSRNMVVTAKGKSLDNTKLGETVRVANLDTKKVVTGFADKNHVVRVSQPVGVY